MQAYFRFIRQQNCSQINFLRFENLYYDDDDCFQMHNCKYSLLNNGSFAMVLWFENSIMLGIAKFQIWQIWMHKID